MASVTPPSAICTIDSIKLGTKELPTNESQNFLVKRINAFVQTEIFKKAVENNPGKYRLRLENNAIVLEKQNGDTWEKKELTSTASAATVATTSTAAAPSAPTPENQHLKTFTAAFRHFENAARFQQSQRSAYGGNTCYLDAPFSLARNIPSLYKTFLTDAPDAKDEQQLKTKKVREASNGSAVRTALGISGNDQDDAEVFFQKLGAGDSGKKLASYRYELKNGHNVVADDQLQDLFQVYDRQYSKDSNQDKAAERSAFRDFFRAKGLDGSSTPGPRPQDSSDGTILTLRPKLEQLDFQHLYNEQFQDKTLNISEQNYTLHKTLDYSQPLMINLGTHNQHATRMQIQNIPNSLEDPQHTSESLHLQGFVAYSGNRYDGHWVAYFRKLELDGSYKWYKDNDVETSIQEVTDDELAAEKLNATYLYYDPDNYDNSDQAQSSRSRSSSISSNDSFVSALGDDA